MFVNLLLCIGPYYKYYINRYLLLTQLVHCVLLKYICDIQMMQYKNVRPDYLKNIWKVMNWKYASEVYEKECPWGEAPELDDWNIELMSMLSLLQATTMWRE